MGRLASFQKGEPSADRALQSGRRGVMAAGRIYISGEGLQVGEEKNDGPLSKK
jgi:hypothetical protein